MLGKIGAAAIPRASPLDWGGLAGALVFALVVRALWAALVPVAPVSDSHLYHEFARSLASGRGFAYPDGTLTAYWPVGTSAVYAVLYRLFGEGFGIIVALNIGLGLGIVWLTYRLASRYFPGRVAHTAAWIVAAWPLLVQFTTVLASELLFITLLLAALCAWGAATLGPLTRGAAFGALLCAAVYMRPTAAPLIVLVPAMQAWRNPRWRESLQAAIVALLVAALLMAPWALRNQQLFGHAALVSTNFGANFWMGNNPLSEGGYMPLPDENLGNEVAREATLKRRAIEFIRAHPGVYAGLSLRRLIDTHDRETIGVHWNEDGLRRAGATALAAPLKLVSSLYWLVVAAAALAGVAVALRRGPLRPAHLLTATPLLFIIVPTLTVSQDRYHMPLIPFAAIFAAVAIRAVAGLRDAR